MHPFCTYQLGIFLLLCHTMTLCNWDLTSISFDVLNSENTKKDSFTFSYIYGDMINENVSKKKGKWEKKAYRSLCIEIPRSRWHILRNMWINFFSIFINFCRSKPNFSGFFKFHLFHVILPGFESHCNQNEDGVIGEKLIFKLKQTLNLDYIMVTILGVLHDEVMILLWTNEH